MEAGSTTEMSLTFRNKSCSQNVFGLKISLSTENKGIEFEKNSFYVQVLAPGEAITLEQMITITENCDPGQAVIAFTGISTVSIVYKTDGISEASSLTRTGWMI